MWAGLVGGQALGFDSCMNRLHLDKLEHIGGFQEHYPPACYTVIPGTEPSVYLVSVHQQNLFYFIFLSKFKSFQLQLTYILASGVHCSDEIVT